jgi:2,3-bisphosphoglycerate-independent phosphoglycerate mutase
MAKLSRRQAERLMAEIQETLKGMMVKVRAEETVTHRPALVFSTERIDDGELVVQRIPVAGRRYEAECLDAINFLACVDQLVSERYTETSDEVLGMTAMARNPRHKVKRKIQLLLTHWGAQWLEQTSDAVIARRLVDQAVEEVAWEAWQARTSEDAEGMEPGGEADRVEFERWWLSRG